MLKEEINRTERIKKIKDSRWFESGNSYEEN